MNLPPLKKACWAVYFYRNQYFFIQCRSYEEATQFVNSLKEKPAVDPLGIYRLKRDEFSWKLRPDSDRELLKVKHQSHILKEIETLKTQLNMP